MYRIAIVDDDKDSRTILVIVLEGRYETIEFNNAPDLLNWFQQGGEANLVLSDISMPGIDGIELARKIRTDLKLTDLPLIAVTAHATESHKTLALAAGFNEYLTKPLNFSQLQRTLDVYLPAQRNLANSA
jgi:CheY-like chemotaxis protein